MSCVAIGMPDPYAGELPMAFVKLTPGTEATADELLQYAQQEIQERAAVPKRIIFVDEIPTTAVGKIFRPALRQQITQQVVQEALLTKDIVAGVIAKLDSKKGMTISVTLNDPEQQGLAESALEGYPGQIDFR